MKKTPDCIRNGMLLILTLLVCACAGQPFDPPQTGEIPEGPGIFTDNPEGALVIRVGEDDANPASTDSKEVATNSETGAVPATSPDKRGDYADFDAYRQWLEWKETAKGTAEYEEFQEWREWRRYREWKQQN